MVTEERKPLAPTTDKPVQFSNKVSIVCSCLGAAVGTGNIWRFPRVAALSSGDEGAMAFLIVWMFYLFLWSIPMLVIEYGIGRYTRKAVVQSFHHMVGLKFLWASLFISLTNFFIVCYYTVLMGWSLYYVYHTIAYPLPEEFETSSQTFNAFTQSGGYPVLTQLIALLLTAAAVFKGVRTLEKANLVITPLFLAIILLTWVWSLTRPHALRGIAFLFSPDWGSLQRPGLWIESLSQNAFDTGAGTGTFIAYASYMAISEDIVKYSLAIPICNNLISLVCGMTSFSTAFSSLTTATPNITNAEVLEVLRSSGPAATGITFIWYPVLLSSAGTLGRVFAAVFYLGLFFAGLSSNISNIENSCHNLVDLGVSRPVALALLCTALFLVGLGSALSPQYLDNQDFTWGVALILTGVLLQVMVIRYGVRAFREVVVNGMADGHWKLPRVWEWIIKYVVGVEAGLVLIFWLVSGILNGDADGHAWYQLAPTTVITVIIQWAILLCLVLVFNACLYKLQPEVLIDRLDAGNVNNGTKTPGDEDDGHVEMVGPTDDNEEQQ